MYTISSILGRIYLKQTVDRYGGTMRYFKKFEGKNIYLSPMNLEDLDMYTNWMNSLSVQIPLGNFASTYSLTREKEALEKMVKEDHMFAVVHKEGDRLIGNCSLFSVNYQRGVAEIGLFIGDESDRGKGYGPELIEILLSYGFKLLGLNNIMLRVFAFNKRGIKAYEKVGFKVFGIRREAYKLGQKCYDEVHMDILASEFTSDCLDGLLPD